VNGQILLVWTEGTGWARRRLVAWQLFDAGGSHGRRKALNRGSVLGMPSVLQSSGTSPSFTDLLAQKGACVSSILTAKNRLPAYATIIRKSRRPPHSESRPTRKLMSICYRATQLCKIGVKHSSTMRTGKPSRPVGAFVQEAPVVRIGCRQSNYFDRLEGRVDSRLKSRSRQHKTFPDSLSAHPSALPVLLQSIARWCECSPEALHLSSWQRREAPRNFKYYVRA